MGVSDVGSHKVTNIRKYGFEVRGTESVRENGNYLHINQLKKFE